MVNSVPKGDKTKHTKGQTRNRVLNRGINALGKAAMMKKSHKWRFLSKAGKKVKQYFYIIYIYV